MSILNTITGETISVNTYKKRCELEDYDMVARGTYREWSADEIEQEYHDEFLADKDFDIED